MSARVFKGRRAGTRTVKGAAKKVAPNVKRYVKNVVHKSIEPKYVDTAVAYGQIDRGGQITQLTTISQGSGISANRIADQVRLKSLEFRMDSYLNCIAAATDSTHHLRLVIFRWNLSTAVAAPVLANLFQATGTVGITCYPRQWQTVKQKDMHVYWDKSFTIQRYAGNSSYVKKINLKGSRLDFDTGAATGEGHLYACLVADDATGAHVPSIYSQFVSRVIYEDA